MGSSGSASVYCLKKFKENYLKNKERIDEELRDEYDIDLGDISDLSYEEIGVKLFGNDWKYNIEFFNESFILYGCTYDNREWQHQWVLLEVAMARIASTIIY
jgi:hypothetical protein